MKLGKKERLQLLAFGAVLALGALWALIQFVVVPMAKSRSTAKYEIIENEKKLDAGDAEVKTATGADDQARAARATLRDIDEKYILKPDYGNYLIRAQDCAKRIAAACNITNVDAVNPVGELVIPPSASPPKKGQKLRVKAYVVEVAVRATYDSLVKLFDLVDADSPYFLITGPKIAAGQDPVLHTVTFRLYWPIWSDTKIPEDFAEPPEGKTPGAKSRSKDGEKK